MDPLLDTDRRPPARADDMSRRAVPLRSQSSVPTDHVAQRGQRRALSAAANALRRRLLPYAVAPALRWS
jgi:hypothetical protein